MGQAASRLGNNSTSYSLDFFSLHMLPLVDMVSRDVLLSKLPFLVHVMFTFYTSGLWRAIVHHLKMICI
jgi:hypothetical protein